MRRKSNTSDTVAGGCTCTMFLITFLVCASIGPFCFSYGLDMCFDKNAPLWVDIVGGIVLGQAAVPSAVICWLVDFCGIAEKPFFGDKQPAPPPVMREAPNR